MFCRRVNTNIFLLVSMVALPVIGLEAPPPITGSYKPDRPSIPAPQKKFAYCIEFEKEINKYEGEVKKLHEKIAQEKMQPTMKSKKKSNKKSKDNYIIDRSNPQELADQYKNITTEARGQLREALKWGNEDTDRECERRLERFNILIKGNKRYRTDEGVD